MTETLVHNMDRASETLSPETRQQDRALENDSMVFLSAIEQLAVRLNDHLMSMSPALALAALVDLANRIVEFAEQLPMARARKFSLEALVARDLPNFAQLGLQHVLRAPVLPRGLGEDYAVSRPVSSHEQRHPDAS